MDDKQQAALLRSADGVLMRLPLLLGENFAPGVAVGLDDPFSSARQGEQEMYSVGISDGDRLGRTSLPGSFARLLPVEPPRSPSVTA